VEAFECSSELSEIATQALREQRLSGRVELCGPDEVPDQMGVHDGCFVGFGAYMHIVGREHRVKFLTNIRAHVKTGGPILVSFSPRHDESFRFRLIRAAAWAAQPFGSRSHRVELGDTLSGRFDHFFSERELAEELAKAGFQLKMFRDQPFASAVGHAV